MVLTQSTQNNQIAVAQQFAQSIAPQAQAPQSTQFQSTQLGGSGSFGGKQFAGSNLNPQSTQITSTQFGSPEVQAPQIQSVSTPFSSTIFGTPNVSSFGNPSVTQSVAQSSFSNLVNLGTSQGLQASILRPTDTTYYNPSVSFTPYDISRGINPTINPKTEAQQYFDRLLAKFSSDPNISGYSNVTYGRGNELPFGLQKAVNIATNPQSEASKKIISGKEFNPFVPQFYVASKSGINELVNKKVAIRNEFGGFSPANGSPQSVQETNYQKAAEFLSPRLASLSAGLSISSFFSPAFRFGTEGEAQAPAKEKSVSEQISENKFESLGNTLNKIEKEVASKSTLNAQANYIGSIRSKITNADSLSEFDKFVKSLIDKQVIKLNVQINPDGTLIVKNLAPPKPIEDVINNLNKIAEIKYSASLTSLGKDTIINPENVRSLVFVPQEKGQIQNIKLRETPFIVSLDRFGTATESQTQPSTLLQSEQNLQVPKESANQIESFRFKEAQVQPQPQLSKEASSQISKESLLNEERLKSKSKSGFGVSLGSGSILKSKISKSAKDIFQAITKRRGKEIVLGESSNPLSAERLAVDTSLRTLARSVIVREKSTGRQIPILNPSTSLFRVSKRNPLTLVQSNALSSKSETTEIQAARRKIKPKSFAKARKFTKVRI